MINSATIRILDQDRKGNYIDIEVPNTDGKMTNEEFIRFVYQQAQIQLDSEFPNVWHYAYATLKDGTHGDTDDVNLIADDGFNGQFQFKSSGAGSWVPCVVSFDDPEADQVRELEAQARAEETKRKNDNTQLILDKIPSMEIIDLEAYKLDYEANQEDEYGRAIIKYAERFARLLQAAIRFHLDMYKLEHTRENVLAVMQFAATPLSNMADFEDISGTMFSFSVGHLNHCWRYGSELMTWDRLQYKDSDEYTVWKEADPRVLSDLAALWSGDKVPYDFMLPERSGE
jgi:hypothetical protein